MEHLFDNILEKDEVIVKIIKPVKARYWTALAFPFAIPLFWPHLILLVVLSLFTLPFLYAHGYKNLWYAYTNKRLIVRSGMIGVDYRTLDYQYITATNVDVGLLDKGGKTGSIGFKSPTTSIAFRYVTAPYELLKEIKEYISTLPIASAVQVNPLTGQPVVTAPVNPMTAQPTASAQPNVTAQPSTATDQPAEAAQPSTAAEPEQPSTEEKA